MRHERQDHAGGRGPGPIAARLPADPVRRLALGGIAVGLGVLGLKLVAWALTGAVALYADALESVINVVAAIVAYRALAVSAMPADAEHPYGHGKAEYLSAVFEGTLIGLAALSILAEAVEGLAAPAPIEAPALGLALNAAASALNGLWGWTILRAGRRLRSPALKAGGRHLLTDVASSGGVVAGLALATLTGWATLDPLIALAVAGVILWQGYRLLREAAGGLMDEAVDADLRARIRAAIGESGTGAIEAHDIRTRVAGRQVFVDFHLIVPGVMTVAEAHAICDRIEAAVDEALPGEAAVTIHVEPEHKAKPHAAVRF